MPESAASSSPKVTAVIPTHNRAGLLARAICSALDQDVATEVIVVDDCSTDHTSDVLASFGDSIRVLRTERNIERGAARNLGAREARGRILAFLDSDDEWKPGKLGRQQPLAAKGIPSVTGIEFVDATGATLRTQVSPPPAAWDEIWLENRLLGSGSSLVIPSELFQRVGGYPERWSVQASEDWLLLVKLRAAGYQVEIVREPLLRCLVHSANSTGDPERFAVSMWSAVDHMAREGYVMAPRLQRVRGRTATVIARGFAATGAWEEALGWLRVAVREGTPQEAARALTLVPASAGRALLRRIA